MKKALMVSSVAQMVWQFSMPNIKMLVDDGYKVAVAANFKEGNACKQEEIDQLKKQLNKWGVSVYQIDFTRSGKKLNLHIKAYKQLKKIIDENKYQIVHCQSPIGAAITRAASRKARKKYNTRVIYSAHGFHFYSGAPIANWAIYYPIEKYLSKYTDAIITTNSEDYAKAKKKFSKRCNNIFYVLGPGVSYNKFTNKLSEKKKNELRRQLGIRKKDFVMIFAARLDKNKNQSFLIDSMNELIKVHDDIHLILPGKDENNGEYQKIALNSELSKYIHFLGPRDDVPNLLQISDLAVSSSIREGLGLNLVEAVFSGIPFVASNNRGHRVIVEQYPNCGEIYENKNDFIKRVLNRYNNRQRVIVDIKKSPFETENIMSNIRAIYKKVI